MLKRSVIFICMLLLLPLTVLAATIQLPQTGQTVIYAAGDDGELHKGIAWPNPRFTDNGDQTMTDNLTGLIWTKNGGTAFTTTWQQALDYIKALNNSNYLGYSDWRLPNRNELRSLVNIQLPNQADWLNSQGFTYVLQGLYWSSSTSTDYLTFAFSVNMVMGDIPIGYKGYYYHVWPVRSGQSGTLTLPQTGSINCFGTNGYWRPCSGTEDGAIRSGVAWPAPRFTDNSDQTITDNLTGLIWTKNGNPAAVAKTWQQALDYINILNNSNYLGYSDWRLPNRNELESLLHIQYSNTAFQLNQQGFTNVVQGWYWSSSTNANDTTQAWTMNMIDGWILSRSKTSYPWNVWPVRAGQGGISVITVSPISKDFGNVSTNMTSAAQTFTISNSGTANLLVSAIATTGNDSGMFTVTPGTCNSLMPTIASNSNCTISVTFAPTSIGNKSTTLRITSNDSSNLNKDIALTGTGIVPTYNISTAVVGGNGNISCNSPVTYGNNSICAVTPNTGYRLETFTDNDADKISSVFGNSYTINNITADHAIKGTFAPKIVPVITWANPADIIYGTPLSGTQLNATANVSGAFVYTPTSGTTLNAGTQTLSVTFTPTDTVNYATVTKTVSLNVAKADQTITFPTLGSKKAGDPDFNPGATASSGLPVTYTSSNPSVAVISGGLIQIVGGGTATITASQPGNLNYNPAPNQMQTLTVTGRPSKTPAITISNPTDGATTSNPSLNIVGNVDGLKRKNTITINIINNGTTTSYTVTPASLSGNFSQTVVLGNGENIIEIVAVNKWGSTTDKRTVTLISP